MCKYISQHEWKQMEVKQQMHQPFKTIKFSWLLHAKTSVWYWTLATKGHSSTIHITDHQSLKIYAEKEIKNKDGSTSRGGWQLGIFPRFVSSRLIQGISNRQVINTIRSIHRVRFGVTCLLEQYYIIKHFQTLKYFIMWPKTGKKQN